MRLGTYKPAPNGIDCPHEDRGGPCWGQVRVVDEQDTESQHVKYYACEAHALVAMYGCLEYYGKTL